MPSWPQPRRIVEPARANAHQAIPRRATNPGAAFGANPPRVEPTAIGHALEWARFYPTETKAGFRHNDPQGERAARQTLAVGAVARVDQLRSFGDLVADFAALASRRFAEVSWQYRLLDYV
jgi:hypothetical protein